MCLCVYVGVGGLGGLMCPCSGEYVWCVDVQLASMIVCVCVCVCVGGGGVMCG